MIAWQENSPRLPAEEGSPCSVLRPDREEADASQQICSQVKLCIFPRPAARACRQERYSQGYLISWTMAKMFEQNKYLLQRSGFYELERAMKI